jgi:glycosyltransferase involved in cell wall biosynthesis
VEILVINDASTDYPKEVFDLVKSGLLGENNPILRYFETQNGNPADTRNDGIRLSQGEYIVCLDADDQLGDPRFLQTLSDALDENRTLGIVFTGLRMMNAEGTLGNVSQWPTGYSFDEQIRRHNQVPTCNMFRKEAWSRSGGYRRRYVPAEDADLWLRMGSLGYRARQVTKEPWFVYRLHADSLSKDVRTGVKPEPDWIGDKPWIKDEQRPFASDGIPPLHSWPVRNYNKPVASVIIPVGPEPLHSVLVKDALDSLEMQTERFWEVIVVNDSGKPLDLTGYPFARVVNTDGALGSGYARNLGIQYARAPLVVFLDADDILLPEFLTRAIKAYQKTGAYVYTDWLSLNKAGLVELHETPEPEPGDVFRKTSINAVTVLIPKAWIKAVNGFDEEMTAWEDVDFFMRLAVAGYCGVRVPEPLFLYRYGTGHRRESGEAIKPDLLQDLRDKFGEYIRGEKMCNCGNTPKPKTDSQPDIQMSIESGAMVRAKFIGPMAAADVRGPTTNTYYGRRENGDILYVLKDDLGEMFTPLAEVIVEHPIPTEVPPPPLRLEEIYA